VWTDRISHIFYIAKELANLSNVIMVIQYINITQFVRHRFRNLNQQLAKCCNSKSHISDNSLMMFRSGINGLHTRTTQTASTANNWTDIPTTLNCILPDISVPVSNIILGEVSRILTLSQTYSDLYDTKESINGIYGYHNIWNWVKILFRSFHICNMSWR